MTMKSRYNQDFWGSGQKSPVRVTQLTSDLIMNGNSARVVNLDGDELADAYGATQKALWATAQAAGTPLPPPPPAALKWAADRQDLGQAIENGSLRIKWHTLNGEEPGTGLADFNVGLSSEKSAYGKPIMVAATIGELFDGGNKLPYFLMEVRQRTGPQHARTSEFDRLNLFAAGQSPVLISSGSYKDFILGYPGDADKSPEHRNKFLNSLILKFLTGSAKGGRGNEVGRRRIVGGTIDELLAIAGGASKKNPRPRRNPSNFVVFHADHGIKPEQMDFIKNKLAQEAPQGFFIREITLPRELGTVRNAMYGPASGDAPVPESAVSYRPRGDRPWTDRVVTWPTRPVDYVQAIGVREGDDFKLFTVYGGPLAPQNPADPGCRDVPAAEKFWSEHALSLEQWS
jgi:hypothetical protein